MTQESSTPTVMKKTWTYRASRVPRLLDQLRDSMAGGSDRGGSVRHAAIEPRQETPTHTGVMHGPSVQHNIGHTEARYFIGRPVPQT